MLKWWRAANSARKSSAVTPTRRNYHTIQAIPREISGHRVAVRERAHGRIPAVVFSQNYVQKNPSDPTSIVATSSVSQKLLLTTERKQIKAILKDVKLPFFCSTTFPLQIRAGSGSSTILDTKKVLPIKLHRDEEGNILNVVLVWAEDGTELKVDVPIVFKGEDVCPGLKKGRTLICLLESVDAKNSIVLLQKLLRIRTNLKYLCPAEHIPAKLEVDVSNLDIGDSISMHDVVVHPSLKLLSKDETMPNANKIHSRKSVAIFGKCEVVQAHNAMFLCFDMFSRDISPITPTDKPRRGREGLIFFYLRHASWALFQFLLSTDFGAFSSSSSKRHSDDDSVIVSEGRYSVKAGFLSGRRTRNRGRSRKVRYVSEKDDYPWRSPSRSDHSASARSPAPAPSKPQPLPMPELHVLLRMDPKFASPSVPLPSSRGANQNQRGGYEERERDREMQMAETLSEDEVDGLNGLRRLYPFSSLPFGFTNENDGRIINSLSLSLHSRISRLHGQTNHSNTDHPETRPCRCKKSSARKHTPKKAQSPYGYRINIPISAPTSPYSSPALSPPGCDMLASHYMTPPSVFHVWSAPEIPYSAQNCSFFQHTPFEKVLSSVDSSPLQSPTVGPASPLPGLLSPESRREGGGGVHPLPRPPGSGSAAAGQPSPTASVSPSDLRSDFSGASNCGTEMDFPRGNIAPPQLSPIAQVAGKPKVMPIKSRWRKGKLIGRGTYGKRMRQLEQEIKVLSRLKHPNIVQYFGSEINPSFAILLVISYVDWLICTARKPSTVVKLADFGMAKHLSGEAANLSLKGSPYWLAPELLQSVMSKDASTDVALAVDIWSLGCTIIEMMDGKPPWSEYEGAAALFKVLQESPPIPQTLSADGKDFLQCCFRRNPAERPTATKLLEHPFVNGSSHHQSNACIQSLKDMRLTAYRSRKGKWLTYKELKETGLLHIVLLHSSSIRRAPIFTQPHEIGTEFIFYSGACLQ
ncbi:protein kinase [Striga asiatica]|uniref:Protein kinase n=1 Tax=Striga asiatica TaxID=4170 RepID=A0A5A7R1U0_STRAF|nr:protein kinase [Striga asiatica]